MLPGLRFLFAAIVLSISVLVFGLGAAALLRAAHEEFASVPSLRPPPETIFAQPNPNNEALKPVLAMLRVDPPVEEPKAPENQASENTPAAPAEPEAIVTAPAEAEAIVTAPAEPERIAALKPDELPPATVPPEFTVTETPAPSETAPAVADAPAADETKIAATQQSTPVINPAAPAAPEQASAPASPETDLAVRKIATLGGPPVAIQPPPKVGATPDGRVIKKRLQARRAKERRRLAQRAWLARQAHWQPADPFAQPAAPFALPTPP